MAILGLFLFYACSPSDKAAVDKLNSLSYACHYRNIDSTEHYAQEALRLSVHDASGQAEALNNLAFVAIMRMEYDKADSLLQHIRSITDNQVELLVAEVQQMRLCQRRSANRAFYEHRNEAESHLQRLREEQQQLPPRMQQRLVYAESEMAIVNSTYYYYVGLERQSVEALRRLDSEAVRTDTAQYLNFLYNIGAGGILTEGTPQQIHNDEMEFLNRCLSISRRHHYPYFEAQALEGLADHTADLQLAQQALRLFEDFGDTYQIAGAYRTLASCYHAVGDDQQALNYLQQALADSTIQQAPDLVASICEQLSVVYSALNDKSNSDYNRNIYIDLQEQTRQDRELEARAGLLDQAVSQLNWMLLAVIVAILLLLLLLWLFNRWSRQSKENTLLADILAEKQEQLVVARMQVEKGERRYAEQRAKVSLAMSILPLLDRIRHAIGHGDTEYICELTDSINEQNDLLTQWIQLRQGEVSLKIESFPVQQLFDIIGRSKTGFQLKGITLNVQHTEAVVKADRILTLFMLNTLADNARKYTAEGGQVDISAEQTDNYVEVSVSDTGKGTPKEPGHGFGLKNCQGIMEKYRKTSQLFNVCMLQSENRQGGGMRFFFRLPKGIVRLLVLGYWLLAMIHPLPVLSQQPSALSPQPSAVTPLDSAHVYADSAYFCNINGTYERTLLFADSCRQCLNAHYLQQHPKGRLLMTPTASAEAVPAEIQWFQQGIETNYQIILDIRNESAVAALALHDWTLYNYNNKVYTQLFKEMSADTSLADYCRTMQQSRQNKRIAVILLVVLFTSLVPAYYMLYYRHHLNRRFSRERQQQDEIEATDDELRRAELESANLHVANSVLDNCLSALKHETMYYPSRIRQLVDSHQTEQLTEVTDYYRDLYAMFILQATEQAERIPLHVGPVELYGQQVLGNDNLLHYLFELLKVGEKDIQAEVKDAQYVVYQVSLTTQLSPLTSLIIRQIVRDHGEATHRRACGITIENNHVTILLPRYNGKV